MTERDDERIDDALKATAERAARRERGEDPGPIVMYAKADGKMQRVDGRKFVLHLLKD
jgi:hypothetical protein